MALAADANLFHTVGAEAFAVFTVGEHREIWPIKSKMFRLWLMRRFYERAGKPPGAQALQDALRTLEAKAHFDVPIERVFLRVASLADCIYVDLCNDEWEALEVSCEAGGLLRTSGPIPARARDAVLAISV